MLEFERVQQEKTDDKKQFNGALRDLRDFVYPRMHRKKREQFESTKREALGLAPEKGLKQPYNRMQEESANREKKILRLQERDKNLGVSQSATNYKTVQKLNAEKKRTVEKKRERKSGHTAYGGVAREEKGMLNLSGNYLKSRGLKKG